MMNRSQFLNELGRRLKYIPKEDREDAIEYYTELMSDMELDDSEDVTAKLGTAKDAAKKILDECTQKHVDSYEENKTVKGQAMIVWLSILSLISLPVSLPLSILVLSLAFAGIIVIISLMIALAATGISLLFSGIARLVAMWMASEAALKVVIFGTGLCILSVGILICLGLYYLIKALIRRLFRKNTGYKKETEN